MDCADRDRERGRDRQRKRQRTRETEKEAEEASFFSLFLHSGLRTHTCLDSRVFERDVTKNRKEKCDIRLCLTRLNAAR